MVDSGDSWCSYRQEEEEKEAAKATTVATAAAVSANNTVAIVQQDDNMSVADSGIDGSMGEQEIHANITTDFEKAKRLRRLLKIFNSPKSQQSINRLKKITLLVLAGFIGIHVAEFITVKIITQSFSNYIGEPPFVRVRSRTLPVNY